VGGISGTLNELLACAGVTLDSNPATLVAGTLVGPSHLRTMGFKLELNLYVSQDLFGDLTCDITVLATPITTVAYHNNLIPSAFPNMGALADRMRVHGVDMNVHVRGRISTWSLKSFVQGAVDILVVLSIPRTILYFLAMYMMGPISQVYRGAARSRLNIFSKFHSSIAKMLLAEVAYRGLVNDFTSHLNDLCSVTPSSLLQRLVDIFDGLLQEEEILKLAAVVFKNMDQDSTDEIGAKEFMKSCTDDGEMGLATLVRFFRHNDAIDRRFGLQNLLDDTESKTTMVARTSATRLFTPQEMEIASSMKRFGRDFNSDLQTVNEVMGRPPVHEVIGRTVGGDEVGPEERATSEGGPKPSEWNVVIEQIAMHEKELKRQWELSRNVVIEQIALHEKELKRLWDHQKYTVETLMRRMRDVELHAGQALGMLKETVDAHEKPWAPHISLECCAPLPPTTDAATQASTATGRSISTSEGPAASRQPLIHLWERTHHSFLATRPADGDVGAETYEAREAAITVHM